MTRRTLIGAALGAAGAGLAYPTLLEPRWLEVTHKNVPFPAGIRIAHLTDLHYSWAVPLSLIEDAIALALAAKPDLICITGDFVTHGKDFDAPAYTRLFQKLTARVPVYASLGNHDGGKWGANHRGLPTHQTVDRILEEGGVTLLHNRAVRLEGNRGSFHLAGVGDYWAQEVDGEQALRGIPAGSPTVLLSHNPDSKEVLQQHRWDLMLSGHTHGGQVIVPFRGPIYAPVKDFGYVAGLNPFLDRMIHTSRGVGSLGSVRFRCRPEVSILDLRT